MTAVPVLADGTPLQVQTEEVRVEDVARVRLVEGWAAILTFPRNSFHRPWRRVFTVLRRGKGDAWWLVKKRELR